MASTSTQHIIVVVSEMHTKGDMAVQVLALYRMNVPKLSPKSINLIVPDNHIMRHNFSPQQDKLWAAKLCSRIQVSGVEKKDGMFPNFKTMVLHRSDGCWQPCNDARCMHTALSAGVFTYPSDVARENISRFKDRIPLTVGMFRELSWHIQRR